MQKPAPSSSSPALEEFPEAASYVSEWLRSADESFERGDYDRALKLYETCGQETSASRRVSTASWARILNERLDWFARQKRVLLRDLPARLPSDVHLLVVSYLSQLQADRLRSSIAWRCRTLRQVAPKRRCVERIPMLDDWV